MMNICIGTYHIKEDEVFRNDFECTAWYENVMVKAGDYPMKVYDFRVSGDGEISGHCSGVYVDMPGTVVSDYFGALYYGMPISDYDNHKNAGKPSRHSHFMYMHSMAKKIVDGDDTFTLAAGFEARPIKFTNYEGKEVTTYGIFEV